MPDKPQKSSPFNKHAPAEIDHDDLTIQELDQEWTRFLKKKSKKKPIVPKDIDSMPNHRRAPYYRVKSVNRYGRVLDEDLWEDS